MALPAKIPAASCSSTSLCLRARIRLQSLDVDPCNGAIFDRVPLSVDL